MISWIATWALAIEPQPALRERLDGCELLVAARVESVEIVQWNRRGRTLSTLRVSEVFAGDASQLGQAVVVQTADKGKTASGTIRYTPHVSRRAPKHDERVIACLENREGHDLPFFGDDPMALIRETPEGLIVGRDAPLGIVNGRIDVVAPPMPPPPSAAEWTFGRDPGLEAPTPAVPSIPGVEDLSFEDLAAVLRN